jgi:hypothetical protein
MHAALGMVDPAGVGRGSGMGSTATRTSSRPQDRRSALRVARLTDFLVHCYLLGGETIMKLCVALSLSLAILIGAVKESQAISMCFEPSEPGCIAYKIGDWDENDFRLCKMEVERYLNQLSTWQDCVIDEADRNAKHAVNKFNCYAKGGTFCV